VQLKRAMDDMAKVMTVAFSEDHKSKNNGKKSGIYSKQWIRLKLDLLWNWVKMNKYCDILVVNLKVNIILNIK